MKKEKEEEEDNSSLTELPEDAGSIPLINTNYTTTKEEFLPKKRKREKKKEESLDNDVGYWPIFFDSTLPNGPIDLGKRLTPNLKVASIALLKSLPTQVEHLHITDMNKTSISNCTDPLPEFLYNSLVWFMLVYGPWKVLRGIAKEYYKTDCLGTPMGIYLCYPSPKSRVTILKAKGVPTFFFSPIPKTIVATKKK
jgi:hypothetical protein